MLKQMTSKDFKLRRQLGDLPYRTPKNPLTFGVPVAQGTGLAMFGGQLLANVWSCLGFPKQNRKASWQRLRWIDWRHCRHVQHLGCCSDATCFLHFVGYMMIKHVLTFLTSSTCCGTLDECHMGHMCFCLIWDKQNEATEASQKAIFEKMLSACNLAQMRSLNDLFRIQGRSGNVKEVWGTMLHCSSIILGFRCFFYFMDFMGL